MQNDLQPDLGRICQPCVVGHRSTGLVAGVYRSMFAGQEASSARADSRKLRKLLPRPLDVRQLDGTGLCENSLNPEGLLPASRENKLF